MAAEKEAIGVELRVSVSVAALRDLVRLTNTGLYGLTPEKTAGELLLGALRAELVRERSQGTRGRR